MNISLITNSSFLPMVLVWLFMLPLGIVLFFNTRIYETDSRFAGGRKARWVNTNGEVTRTELFVRKEKNADGTGGKADFLVRIEFTYVINPGVEKHTLTRTGVHEVAFDRLDIARQVAETYRVGEKLTLVFNAVSPSTFRFIEIDKKGLSTLDI